MSRFRPTTGHVRRIHHDCYPSSPQARSCHTLPSTAGSSDGLGSLASHAGRAAFAGDCFALLPSSGCDMVGEPLPITATSPRRAWRSPTVRCNVIDMLGNGSTAFIFAEARTHGVLRVRTRRAAFSRRSCSPRLRADGLPSLSQSHRRLRRAGRVAGGSADPSSEPCGRAARSRVRFCRLLLARVLGPDGAANSRSSICSSASRGTRCGPRAPPSPPAVRHERPPHRAGLALDLSLATMPPIIFPTVCHRPVSTEQWMLLHPG